MNPPLDPKKEVRSFARILVPHDRNSYVRKVTLASLLIVWVAVEVGTTFSTATPPESIWWVRTLVAMIIGRAWGIERSLLETLPTTPTDGGTSRGGRGGSERGETTGTPNSENGEERP